MTAFSAVRPSAIKLKTVTRLGATIEGGLAIDVDKANGTYTVDINYSNVPEADTYDPNAEHILIYNPVDGTYRTVAISTISMNSGTVATQGEAEAGTDNTKMMTPLRTTQHYDARKASQAEAETGTENSKWLSSLRTAQAIDARRPFSSEVQAEGGSNNTTVMTPLRTRQAIAAFRYVANVKDPDFGAVGDGVTDDTLAIQAALSSGAKAVHVPPGTYIISTTLTFPTGEMTLFGDGMEISTIKFASAGGQYVINVQSLAGILIRDITLDANNNAAAVVFNDSPRSKLHRIGAKNTTGSAIGMGQTGGDGCHFSEVIGCRIENTDNHGVYISLSNHVRVNDNFAYNIAWSGIDIAGGTFCTVNNNVLVGVGGSGTGSGFGGIRISNQCFNCSITGNTVSAFSRGIMVIGATYCTFASNTLATCNAQGIFIAAAVLGGGTQANYNTVTGNTVYDVGIDHDTSGIQYAGIHFTNQIGTTNCSGNVTIGNTIVNGFGSRMSTALADDTDGINTFDLNTTNGTLGP